MLEMTELEVKHQEAPDLQGEQTVPGQPWTPCLTQLLEASFTDLHGEKLFFFVLFNLYSMKQ